MILAEVELLLDGDHEDYNDDELRVAIAEALQASEVVAASRKGGNVIIDEVQKVVIRR